MSEGQGLGFSALTPWPAVAVWSPRSEEGPRTGAPAVNVSLVALGGRGFPGAAVAEPRSGAPPAPQAHGSLSRHHFALGV